VKDDCPVLRRIASARVADPDEPLFKALKDCGHALDVPVTTLKLDNTFEYPCLHPRDLLFAFANAGSTHRIFGVEGPLETVEKSLADFWRRFRLANPTHDLSQLGETDQNWSRLLPFYLHGDGGRTYKKDPILVLSMYSALGRGTAKRPASTQLGRHAKRKHDDDSSAEEGIECGVNLLGHSYTHRFLYTAMKAEFYKKKNHRFETLIDFWGQHLTDLYTSGLELNGHTWKVAILGLTGDAPFLRETGFHNRSFSNVKKSHSSKSLCKGVCWLCAAGISNGPPFEDVRVTDAQWLETIGPNNPLPWDRPGPLLAYLPVDQEDLASFYRPDLFHILHAGVGKDFAASCIIYFCAKTFKSSRIGLALDHVNLLFRNFLATEKERVNFSNITFELLGYESSRTYPMGHWSKNLDTAVMIKFVEHVAANNLDPGDPVMQLIVQGSSAINHFMRVLLSAPYWLCESEAWQAIFAGQEFLSAFAGLAQACYHQKLCLFKLKPKLHMFAHIVFRMLQQFRCDTGCTTNPVAEATFMSEDFVGHVSRLSRRVNARRHGHKIYNRYCVAVCQKLRAGDAVKKSQRKYARDQGLF